MLIEQSIEFKLRGPWPPGRIYSYNWLILLQNKNFSGKSSRGLLFIAKILQEAVHRLPRTMAKSLTKFKTKMQNFKRVLDLNCKTYTARLKMRIEQFNLFQLAFKC